MNDDEELTVDVLSSVKGGKLHVATGYMNFTDRFVWATPFNLPPPSFHVSCLLVYGSVDLCDYCW